MRVGSLLKHRAARRLSNRSVPQRRDTYFEVSRRICRVKRIILFRKVAKRTCLFRAARSDQLTTRFNATGPRRDRSGPAFATVPTGSAAGLPSVVQLERTDVPGPDGAQAPAAIHAVAVPLAE